uniref:Arb2 domain-containing protein n=1 Tax=Eutreptiella gymnastica TaxID=73025 RepID=A0A7S1ITH8_9EUGL|mmetsp:Transcript_41592/g.74638  ORF Transcript_41592/g.74638 Transcript_41592/m.74638 type:complete len:446 (+) Transcript_41592:77-1414(+)
MGPFMSLLKEPPPPQERKVRRTLTQLGFEYRPTGPEGRQQLVHVHSGAALNEHNWHIFSGGNYEQLADACMDHIHELMVHDDDLGLQWVKLPVPPGKAGPIHLTTPRARVLATSDLHTNKKGLLVLITGKGGVRTGHWGRKLVIQDSIEHGSQWSIMRAAVERGWAVVSFDPNRNVDDNDRRIPGSETGEAHCIHAWRCLVTGLQKEDGEPEPEKHKSAPSLRKTSFANMKQSLSASFSGSFAASMLRRSSVTRQRAVSQGHFMGASPAKKIAIVAHSAGGAWLLSCLQPQHTPAEHVQRIRAFAFTDSIHTMTRPRVGDRLYEMINKTGVQFRAGPWALDEVFPDDRAPKGQLDLGCGCEVRGSGTFDHSAVNFMAEQSIIKHLDAHMGASPNDEDDEGSTTEDDDEEALANPTYESDFMFPALNVDIDQRLLNDPDNDLQVIR